MSNNGDNKFTINCPHCGQRFSITIPKTEIVNTGRVSMAIVTHEKPFKCICGGSMVLIMQAAQTAWGITGISEQQAKALEGSPIITPPPGMRLIN